MPEPWRGDRRWRMGRAEAGLALLVGSAVVGFALSRRDPVAWLLIVPFALGLVRLPPRVSPALGAFLPVVAWALLTVAASLQLFWSLYPLLPDPPVRVVPLVAGSGLALLASVFLAARVQFPPGRPLIPAALGTLLCAALEVFAPLGLPLLGAGAGVVLYLTSGFGTGRAPPSPDRGGRRAARLAVFAAGALGVALGIARFLPWAQPHVERAAAELAEPPVTSYSGLSSSSRLGDIQELKLSRRVVMRVWTTRPQKLRARVFTRFDGQVWHVLGGPEREMAPEAIASDADLAGWLDAIPGRSFRDPREA